MSCEGKSDSEEFGLVALAIKGLFSCVNWFLIVKLVFDCKGTGDVIRL